MKNFRLNKKGFTLIELMIVIAIIGVLAAIAIPNFISYRARSYCSATESTARSIGAAIAAYYSVPTRTAAAPATGDLDFSSKELDRFKVTITAGTNGAIEVKATDPTGRCPSDYRQAAEGWTKGSATPVYTFTME